MNTSYATAFVVVAVAVAVAVTDKVPVVEQRQVRHLIRQRRHQDLRKQEGADPNRSLWEFRVHLVSIVNAMVRQDLAYVLMTSRRWGRREFVGSWLERSGTAAFYGRQTASGIVSRYCLMVHRG
jgi:hypothetical protein